MLSQYNEIPQHAFPKLRLAKRFRTYNANMEICGKTVCHPQCLAQFIKRVPPGISDNHSTNSPAATKTDYIHIYPGKWAVMSRVKIAPSTISTSTLLNPE